jgi:hypothetical protein
MGAASDLLADLTQRGIELVAEGDRLRYRPRSAVTPELAQRLRTHKAELLAILGHAEGAGGDDLAERARRLRHASGLPPWGGGLRPGECPRCRSTAFRDVPIHNGQSLRRDCAGCGRFITFVVWYGRLCRPSTN